MATKTESPAPVDIDFDRKCPMLPRCAVEQQTEEDKRRRLVFHAPLGTVQNDVTHPDFWRANAGSLRRGDVIFLIGPFEAWEMELRWEGKGIKPTVWAQKSRTPVKETRVPLPESTDYMAFDGPDGWSVYRPARDGRGADVRLFTGYANEGAAMARWYREQPKQDNAA